MCKTNYGNVHLCSVRQGDAQPLFRLHRFHTQRFFFRTLGLPSVGRKPAAHSLSTDPSVR